MKYLVLVLFVGLSLISFAQDKSAIDFNNEGNEFVRNKDYESAYTAYSKAIELYEVEGKVDTNLIYNAGYCAYKAKKYDDALPFLQKAIEFEYKKAMPYIYVAQVNSKSKDYEAMEKTLLAGLEKYPTDKNLNKLMGSCYLKQGLVPFKAGNKIKKAANVSGLNESDPDAFNAEYAKADAKFQEALPFFEKSYTYNAKSKSTVKALVNVYTNLEMTDKASSMQAELDVL